MGKASKWLRSLLGFHLKSSSSTDSPKDKKKAGFLSKRGLAKNSVNHNDKSLRGVSGVAAGAGRARWSYEDHPSSPYVELDANKHAIAVAAATAAVAEAALAAARAAAEVVRLTSAGTSVSGTRTVSSMQAHSARDRRRELAATKIQSAFRAYLAKRALRALKGLVKLQALVRGRIVRKQSADMLRRMQAMARIQARACSTRANVEEFSHSFMKSAHQHHAGTPAWKKPDNHKRSYSTKGPDLKGWISKPNLNNSIKVEGLQVGSSWLDQWMEECTWNNLKDVSINNVSRDDDRGVKILEIDTWKPHYNPKQTDKTFHGSQVSQAWNENGHGVVTFDPLSGVAAKQEKPNPSLSSGEIPALRSLKFPPQEEQVLAWASENSPCLRSPSSRPGSSCRRGPFTPTRSECSRSVIGDYLSHSGYMANTESSLAKVRSQSAPRQRLQYERPGTSRKYVRGLWDPETISGKGSTQPAELRNKAYPCSGLNRVGKLVQGDAVNFSLTSKGRR